MDWIDVLILGIVQGLAEYLPISSSGHIEIFRQILGLDLPGEDALQLNVVLHVATVLSTIVVLWKQFMPLCRSFFTLRNDDNTRYVWKILLSCVPVGIVGILFKSQVEQFFGVQEGGESNLTLIGICLCVTAALLTFAYLSDHRLKKIREKRGTAEKMVLTGRGRNITWYDALIIGCSQAIAVLPGLSRSGTTIATGIIIGDRREEVAQFSFFMVVIPILGEALLDLKDMLLEGGAFAAAPGTELGWLPLLIGFLASFVVGCLACNWMLSIVKKGKLYWFAIYCVIVGILCICW